MSNFLEVFKQNLEVGSAAFTKGDQATYLAALESTGNMLRHLCQHNEAELALNLELSWYSLVKKIESDDHYANCFQYHANELWSLGKRLSPGLPHSGDSNCIAFIAQNSVLLGHTEVMLLVMSNWRKRYPQLRLLFVGLTACPPNLAERLRAIDVEFITPSAGNYPTLARISWLRETLTREQVGTAVWVSLPLWAPFIFGFGVCARQVFWSLKFHPVHMGPEVIHIGMTKKSRGIESIHGKPWHAFQPPLAVSVRRHSPEAITQIRSNFGDKFLFSTLAREEKFNSPRFATAIATILERCPESQFLFAGRSVSPVLEKILTEHGVASQACFIGWVDTDLFSASVDCFLESFPFGCGVTGVQALSHGTTLISLWDKDTLPSYYFDDASMADRFKPTWHVVTDEEKYVQIAVDCYRSSAGSHTDKTSRKIDTEALDQDKFEQFFHLVTQS